MRNKNTKTNLIILGIIILLNIYLIIDTVKERSNIIYLISFILSIGILIIIFLLNMTMIKKMDFNNGKINTKNREYVLDENVELKYGLYTLTILFNKKVLLLNKEDKEAKNIIHSVYKFVENNFENIKIDLPYKYKNYPMLLNIVFLIFIFICLFLYIEIPNIIWVILIGLCFLMQFFLLFLYIEIIIYDNKIIVKKLFLERTYQINDIKDSRFDILDIDNKPYIFLLFKNNKRIRVSVNKKTKIYYLKLLYNIFNNIKSGHFA